MLLKILLIVVVITIVYMMFFKKSRVQKPVPKGSKTSSKNKKTADNSMVACQVCETYVDTNEALMSSGKYYCSQECLNEK